MRKRLLAFLSVFFISFCFLNIPAYAAYMPPFDVDATNAMLVNTDTGKVVYEKNADDKIYPASLTKIMTTILAYENTEDLDATEVKVPGYIYDEFYGLDVSHAGIERGDVVTMRNLIYGMMVASGNEAASAVADYIGGGSIPAFADMMNQRAKELGCTGTNFVNAHGLFDEDHYTTVRDLYKITSYALTIDGLLDICSTPTYQMSAVGQEDPWTIYNRNSIIRTDSEYYYQYAKGVKTGSLPEVGKNLITTASKDGYNYLLLLIGEPDTDSLYTQAKDILEWAFDSFTVKAVTDVNDPVGEIALKYAWGQDSLQLRPETVYTALVPDNIDVATIEYELSVPDYIEAPVEKGQVIGKAQLKWGTEVLGELNVVAAESVSKSSLLVLADKVKSVVFSFWFKFTLIVVLILIILYILLLLIRNNNMRKYKRVRKNRNL